MDSDVAPRRGDVPAAMADAIARFESELETELRAHCVGVITAMRAQGYADSDIVDAYREHAIQVLKPAIAQQLRDLQKVTPAEIARLVKAAARPMRARIKALEAALAQGDGTREDVAQRRPDAKAVAAAVRARLGTR